MWAYLDLLFGHGGDRPLVNAGVDHEGHKVLVKALSKLGPDLERVFIHNAMLIQVFQNLRFRFASFSNNNQSSIKTTVVCDLQPYVCVKKKKKN